MKIKNLMLSRKKYDQLTSDLELSKAEYNALLSDNANLLCFQGAFEKAPYAMAILDIEKSIYYPNETFSSVFQLDRSSTDGYSFYQLFTDPASADTILDTLFSETLWSDEVEMQKINGDLFWANLRACPFKSESDEHLAVIAFHPNYKKTRALKKNSKLHFHYLQTLQGVTLGIIRHLDQVNLLNLVISKASQINRIENGFIYLYDSQTHKLILKAAHGNYKNHIGHEIIPGDGIIGKVFDQKEPLIEATHDDFHSTIFENQFNIIGVPLISGSKLHGVIGLSDDEKEISEDLIVILEEFSSMAAIVIDNAQLHDDLNTAFQKRLELEQKSKEQERKAKEIVEKQNLELKAAYIDSIHRLVLASEFKDEDTGDHIVRIGKYSQVLARKFGCSENMVENIGYAAPMHDVGKIGIPDRIMLKADKLDPEEFEIMKTHTIIGAKILSESESEILIMASDIALSHHEKYDGTGYPNGIMQDEIPLSARMVAIADTFDALTSKRPYKEAYPPEMALDIIRKESGKHFDPDLVKTFIDHFEAFLEIRESIGAFDEVALENFIISERDRLRFNI